MSSSLIHRVRQVQSAAGRLYLLHGLSRFVIAASVAIAVFCLADFWLRLHHPLARWLLTGGALALVVWLFAKAMWCGFMRRPNTLTTTRQIERRFPALSEHLSSAMAFLSQAQNDRTGGSTELRRAVIAEAEALSTGLDFRSSLSRSSTRSAAFAAVIILALIGFVAAFNPSWAGLAVARLVLPWRNLPWPRQHELALITPPLRLAKGDDFEVAVVDRRGLLPADAEFLIRRETPTGGQREVRPLKPVGERVLLLQANVTQSFEYRVRGGDDDTMPWMELAVVEPPKLTELKVLVQPPAYSGLPPQTGGQVIRALIGSQIRIVGTFDRPIQSVSLKSDAVEVVPPVAAVAASGRDFAAPSSGASWLLERFGTFSLEITDQRGLTYSRGGTIELIAVPDATPSIAWETPSEDQFVTARAVVPIRADVKDDLAVRAVQLRYLREGERADEQIVELYSRPIANPPSHVELGEVDARHVEYQWDLSALAGFAAGDVLSVRLTAEDFKPQTATTSVRRLTIISDEGFSQRSASRQSAILNQLAEALRLAHQSREAGQSLERRFRDTDQLAADDLNQLRAALHSHQQLERMLAGSPESIAGQIAALLADLAANNVDHEASGRQLRALLDQIVQLHQGPLPAIARELTEAIKTSEDSDSPAAEVADLLRLAVAQQDEVVLALEAMVGRLAEWDNLGRIARDLGQMRVDQERLASETDALALKGIGATGDVSAVDRAGARKQAQIQLDLAREFDKLQSRMEETTARLSADDPLAGTALSNALDAARRLAIGSRMREAASRLGQHQFGPARQAVQEVLESLQQLNRTLSPRRDSERAEKHTAEASASNSEQASSKAGISVTPAELNRIAIEQESINAQTTAYQRQRDNGLPVESQQVLAKLAREQGRLAEVVVGLFPKPADSSQDQPLPPSRNSSSSPASSPQPKQSAPKSSSLDQQLLDDLDHDLQPATSPAKQPATTSQNPLSALAEQMRSVQQRLADRDTSTTTQDNQARILAGLNALLEASKQGSEKSVAAGRASAEPGAGTGEVIVGPARDSTNRTEPGTREAGESASAQEVIGRVWGHLPAQLREQMQSSLSEQFLPQYERLIEEYYKRLAEDRPAVP